MRSFLTAIAFVCAGAGVVEADEADEAWPRFRGPNGAGVGVAAGVAGTWSDANRLWSAALPGVGHGSPVVWGDRVFVPASNGGECLLLAFDAMTGRELWRRGHAAGGYHLHAANNYASATPAVDANRVYYTGATKDAAWVAAYSHGGDLLWERSLGPFANTHGFASSPIVAGGVLVIADDQLGDSAIVGLDLATGETRWRAAQPTSIKAAYATPCVVEVAGKPAIIIHSMSAGMASLDVASGEEIWRQRDAFVARCVSSPVAAGPTVLGVCGGGGGGKLMVAMRYGGQQPEVAYRLRKSLPYVPTPLVLGDLMLLWHDRGTVAGVDPATGQKLWEERVGGRYFASPVSVGDAVLSVSTDGEVVTLAADRAGCRVLARNPLDEPTNATPAIAHNRLYVRTASKLHCIGGAETALRAHPAEPPSR